MPILRKAIYTAVILGVIGLVDLHQVDASLSGTYTGWAASRKKPQTLIREHHIFQQPDADDSLKHEEQDEHDEEEAKLPQDDDALAKVRSMYDSNVKLPEALKLCLKTDVYPLDGNPSVMMRRHAFLSKLHSLADDQLTKECVHCVHILSLLILTWFPCAVSVVLSAHRY